MPPQDLKKIEEKLNKEFSKPETRLVFWYDDDGDFLEEIEKINLNEVKFHKLERGDMFQTKYLLEFEDPTSKYLVYAPFPKPEVIENILEDTLLYSSRFNADRISLVMSDLLIEEKYKPILKKYKKLFAAKERADKFCDLGIEEYTEETIEIGLFCVLSKTKQPSFEEVLRKVFIADKNLLLPLSVLFEVNPLLTDFENYELLSTFWKYCEILYGFTELTPTMQKLALTFFTTYTVKQLKSPIPAKWTPYLSSKSGNIIAFLDNLRNHTEFKKLFNNLSDNIAQTLNIKEEFASLSLEDIIDCDAFKIIDEFILEWIKNKLLDENIIEEIRGLNIPAICEYRKKKHFRELYNISYNLMESAYYILKNRHFECSTDHDTILYNYLKKDYLIDTNYRLFYMSFDQIEDNSIYEDLRQLIENVYTNKFLNILLTAWNAPPYPPHSASLHGEGLYSQSSFFTNHIKHTKEKTVVIISDALRYEVAQELLHRLNNDPNCSAEMKYSIALLPTYTQLGMAALLPHKTLEITENAKVLVDGQASDTTEKRESLLQKEVPKSRCVSYDGLSSKNDELREIFTGKDIVYVYHNHIDKIASAQEHDVFKACSETINKLYTFIRKMYMGVNVFRFIVTADHGFLYKRDKFAEDDKIDIKGQEVEYINRRYILSDQEYTADGVFSIPFSDKKLTIPIGASVFKTQGNLNYVHGGSSPQEMILPIIWVKAKKGHIETHPAKISLISTITKITNLITQLEFLQPEVISDIVKPATYTLYFMSEDNEVVSNKIIFKADKDDPDDKKRMFRLQFNFINKKYDPQKKYWLIVINTDTNIESFRSPIKIDIAFADDFGFGE